MENDPPQPPHDAGRKAGPAVTLVLVLPFPPQITMRLLCFGRGLLLGTILSVLFAGPTAAQPRPEGGALSGDRYRVLISTDLGGLDEDDHQSMVHLLLYSDLFDLEGLVSSPPADGRMGDILDVIDVYAKDYPTLRTHSQEYPSPDRLRSITKQGATDPAPDRGWSHSTPGSDWIIEQAHEADSRPLYVLVWGSITDVAQAVHDAPSIKDDIRVYFIASWNRRQDPAAYRYLNKHHPDLWMVYSNTTFRGWYRGGTQDSDLGNESFVQRHVKGHGALGELFVELEPHGQEGIKMGDTPSVAYLLRGDPADPTGPHWGGRFVPHPEGRPNWWVDDPDSTWQVADRPGARTVSRHREAYLRHWQKRMDRAAVPAYAPDHLATGDESAPLRGVYEIRLSTENSVEHPHFGTDLQVTFTRPDGSTATVDGFYDGDGRYKARAYADTTGRWRWTSTSNADELDGRSGSFTVVDSPLKGKLRIHPEDPHQFAYDDGSWFLHLGDTGYRYVVNSEPKWRSYIDQAAQMGATKVRTWFARARSTVGALFNEDRDGLNLSYWQEIDHRLRYALEKHPNLQFLLIPYAEDTDALRRYPEGDSLTQFVAEYAQARFSAFPNVHWEISNDREIVTDDGAPEGREVRHSTIAEIGRDMAAREPWGTLLTNQQARYGGYSFVDAPWSDITTLEDLDQVEGALIETYRQEDKAPVVIDEDRYEYWRNPAHDRYFFRRLMWASLLSGGHATYGGLRTYEAYDGGPTRGVQGYFDANRAGVLEQGAHDFRHIHNFFRETELTLVGFQPADAMCGADSARWKCARRDGTVIAYLANPSGETPKTDAPAAEPPEITVKLPDGRFNVRWFNPSSGTWTEDDPVSGGTRTLSAPNLEPNHSEDWVLLLRDRK